MSATIELCVEQSMPIFGVCLGLQGLVEYFGGTLDVLTAPMHGKFSKVKHRSTSLFAGVEPEFEVGRYHSLFASEIPADLQVTAQTEDDCVMAIEHRSLPIRAVQFHPESIMTLENQSGHKIIQNVISLTAEDKRLRRVG